jgi:hypothetical protein
VAGCCRTTVGLKCSITVTEPSFTELVLARKKSANNSHTEFQERITDISVSDARSRTDGQIKRREYGPKFGHDSFLSRQFKFFYASSYSHLTLIDRVPTTALHAPYIQNQAAHTQRKHKALCRSHCKSLTTTSKMCLALPTMGSTWHPTYFRHVSRSQSVPCIFNEELPPTLICKDQTFYRCYSPQLAPLYSCHGDAESPYSVEGIGCS